MPFEVPTTRFLPGRTPRPEAVPAPADPEEAYRYGCFLFDLGYFWEAHEVWEHLWRGHDRGAVEARFLEGLIKCAAALLVAELGREVAARRHAERARAVLVGVAAEVGPVWRGVGVLRLARAVQGAVEGEPPPILAVVPDRERVGPWVVEEVLGLGGMGVVYRCHHHGDPSRKAAVKTLRSGDPGTRRALRRERAALRRLHHPSVVRLLDEGEDGEPWYAMALLAGPTLATLVLPERAHASTWTAELSGPLSTEELAEPDDPPVAAAWDVEAVRRLAWIAHVAHALAHLHADGLVHCDLKPENVIVCEGRAVVVDFGLVAQRGARIDTDSIARAARVAGTAAYMSPERVRRLSFDARADLYALGCLIVAVLTGEPPFPGTSTVDMLLAQVATPPPRLSERMPGVPAELDALVERLMAKRAEERPGHAHVVLDVLRRVGVAVPDWPLPRRAPLYTPSLHGRSEPLATLEALAGEALSGEGRLVWIEGSGGVGKSRLAEAVVARAGELPTVLAGRCSAVMVGDEPVGSGVVLEAFHDVFRHAVDLARDVPWIAARLAGPAAVLATHVPVFRELVEPALPATTQQLEQLRLRQAVLDVLTTSLAGPTVLVFDDLQWAGPLTRSVVGRLAEAVAGQPWLVLCLGRPSAFEAPASAVCLELEPLAVPDVRAMVADMLAVPAPAPLAAWIDRRAGGNPFFVAECLRAAVDAGWLALDPSGAWQFTGDDAVAREPLPQTLADVVGRRLGALGDAARALAEVASVLGRTVPWPLLVEVAAMDPATLDRAVEDLERTSLVAMDHLELEFAHDRLVEMVYEGIDPARRVALHRVAAAVLSGTDASAEARHLEAAGDAAAAAIAYGRAARERLDRLAFLEAEPLFAAAVRLTPDRGARAALQVEWALQVLQPLGRLSEVFEVLEAAVEWIDDEVTRLRAQLGAARALISADPHTSRARLEALREPTRRASPHELYPMVLSALGRIVQQFGDPREAERLQRQAFARFSGSEATSGTIGRDLAKSLLIQGRYDEAAAFMERMLAWDRARGQQNRVAADLSALANAYSFLGRYEAAIPLYEEALDLERGLGNRWSEGTILNNLASATQRLLGVVEATPLFEEALTVHRAVGNRRFEGVTLRALALGALGRGDIDGCLARLGEAEAALVAVGEKLWLAHVDAARCKALRYARRLDDAMEAGQRALERYAEVAAPTELGDGIEQVIRTRIARGEPFAEDLERLRELARSAREGSMLHWCVTRTVRTVEALETGEPVLAGEREQDLGPELLDRIRATYA